MLATEPWTQGSEHRVFAYPKITLPSFAVELSIARRADGFLSVEFIHPHESECDSLIHSPSWILNACCFSTPTRQSSTQTIIVDCSLRSCLPSTERLRCLGDLSSVETQDQGHSRKHRKTASLKSASRQFPSYFSLHTLSSASLLTFSRDLFRIITVIQASIPYTFTRQAQSRITWLLSSFSSYGSLSG